MTVTTLLKYPRTVESFSRSEDLRMTQHILSRLRGLKNFSETGPEFVLPPIGVDESTIKLHFSLIESITSFLAADTASRTLKLLSDHTFTGY